MRHTLLLNFKNYPQVLGRGSLLLARAAESVAKVSKAQIIVAPPAPMIGRVASEVALPVFSQMVEDKESGQSTGSIIPESVKQAGCKGTILNHSEARVHMTAIPPLVHRLHSLDLKVCLCARTRAEIRKLSRYRTDYLAIEPPELIGSGVAVSRARPALVRDAVEAAEDEGYRGAILCGAGIVRGEDVEKAVELGAMGVLVSSSVVKADDWEAKIRELSGPLS